MTYRNLDFVSIQDAKRNFYEYCDLYGDVLEQVQSPEIKQLETAFINISSASFKVLHPLFIKSYRAPKVKFRESPLRVAGLDIETNHETGEPMLFGFWHPDSQNPYYPIFQPDLARTFNYIRDMVENTGISNLVTWGKLDIAAFIRLFNPTETERERISKGIGVNWRNGKFSAEPPCIRRVGRMDVYIGHYIPNRSLKIGYIENGHNRTVWIFNCSQFWPKRIADTTRGLGLDWKDFPKDTHLINWPRYRRDLRYKNLCLESNKQDARIVCELAYILQDRFHEVFNCYPTLLVSTGSITDAAVSKMLESGKTEYQSNSWRWLSSNIWTDLEKPQLAEIETLLTESFSGGYVDQFAIGYFSEIYTADIASAYPHKIRALPDLRYSRLFLNDEDLDEDIQTIARLGYDIETAIIRGRVRIPKSLKYHPITIKTYHRQNFRPTGEFYATYTLEERQFCQQYGAKFDEEQYVIVGLTERRQAPIGRVSQSLGEMRAELLAQIDCPKGNYCSTCIVLDSQQNLVKVIDNSIYGKTVMVTEAVEDVNGEPQIVGYVTGDRFNMLYGALITGRTRVQIAQACMDISAVGGRPIMTMTDSVCWQGTAEMLPADVIREEKTFGYFESPMRVEGFYILKTGQYEYQNPYTKLWNYRVRGLPLDFAIIEGGKQSFFRRTIKQHCDALPPGANPRLIEIPVRTRRLLTIGQHDLENLAVIREGTTKLRPFAMSKKQAENYLVHWKDCLDSHIFLRVPSVTISVNVSSQYPLRWLHDEFVGHANTRYALTQDQIRAISRKTSKTLDDRKQLFAWVAMQQSEITTLPEGRYFRLSWGALEHHFGRTRSELNEFLIKVRPNG